MPARGWCVYLLRCRDGSLYTGITNNLPRRLAAHGAGRGGAYTRSRLPVRLVYTEPAAGRGAALRREAAVKRLHRREKWVLVRKTSAPRFPSSPHPSRSGRRAPVPPARRPTSR